MRSHPKNKKTIQLMLGFLSQMGNVLVSINEQKSNII
jgi:hypothetical protein